MRIAWIYEDNEYNERLSEFVRTNKDITYRFSFFQKYKDFVNCSDSFDFIFLEHKDISRANSLFPYEKIACISNNNESLLGEFSHLNIYQNIDKLLLDMKFILNNRKYIEIPTLINREKAIITAVYSASGGSGKTFFSLLISKMFMEQKEKVLLVNLEMYSGININSEEPSFSELILLIKLNESFNDPIPLNKFTINMNGIDIIPSFLNPCDALNISDADITNLINYLSPMYDRIVFDLDVELSQRVISVFNNCDELIEIMHKNETGKCKHLKFNSIVNDINVSHKHRLFKFSNNLSFHNENECLTEVREWYKLPKLI